MSHLNVFFFLLNQKLLFIIFSINDKFLFAEVFYKKIFTKLINMDIILNEQNENEFLWFCFYIE